MVVSPNAVNGALCMIVSFVGTAALFVLLEAYFLAILQVLVYAGAVMVLFLFIIMLLNVDERRGRERPQGQTQHRCRDCGICAAGAFGGHGVCGGEHLPEPSAVEVAANPTGSTGGFEFSNSEVLRLQPVFQVHAAVPGCRFPAAGRDDRRSSWSAKNPLQKLEADAANAKEGDE